VEIQLKMLSHIIQYLNFYTHKINVIYSFFGIQAQIFAIHPRLIGMGTLYRRSPILSALPRSSLAH